jgi:Xaa-Pro dipeptidase
MTTQRIDSLLQLIKPSQLDAIAINPGPTLTYLTGLTFHLMERPTVLLLVPGRQPIIILPELEQAKLSHAQIPLQPFAFGDNPATWQTTFDQAVRALDLDHKTIGVETNRFRFLESLFLQASTPHSKLVGADAVLSQLRMKKDPDELQNMRKAVHIAQEALTNTLPYVKSGVTEREIAAELSIQLLRAGSDAEMPFAPIVSSGPNSANPHASPSERMLQNGDLLVIDWGAYYHGYCSDLTRTFAIGNITPEFKKIASLVAQANAAGRSSARPGIPAGKVDQAARSVISAAGYGAQFFHRTGHGIGMEGHEPPYIFGENDLTLEPGMTFTIEPGIYLAGMGGVRIEDNVAITENGCEVFSDLSRDLITL